MTHSIIQKSQLEGAERLDAEYYQPEFLELKSKLLKYKNLIPLIEVANIQTGPAYFSECIGGEYKVPLARIGDVTNKTEIETWSKLSEKEFEKFKNKKIENGDLLMTMTGDPPDVGKVNLIDNRKGITLAFNQRVAKLSTKDKKINNKYLFAFLGTEFSRFQAERVALGIRQRNLGTEDLKNILVAVPNERCVLEIDKSVSEYLDELENSKNLYSQAENLLLQETKISELDLQDKISSVVKLSETKEVKRQDAEYFQPKYKNLVKHLKKNCDGVELGELVSMKKGIEPGAESYLEEGKQFIRVSSMSKYGINKNDQKYLSEDLYNELKEKFEPKEGEILLTKDASPGIAYVLKEKMEGIISGGTLRLKLKKSLKDEYLALCLNSIIGKMQAERDAGGSVIMHWKPEQIKKIIIPVLPKSTQQKISSLIRGSHSARKKARGLLEEAKRKVEEMIEKG